jgi:hypothetical protein
VGKVFRRCKRRPLLRLLALRFDRDVVAEGFFCHVVAVDCIGPGAAAATDVDVFALPALPFVALEVSQVFEDLAVLPQLLERGLFHVTGGAVEVGAGLEVAVAVDQADGLGGDAPFAATGREGQGPALKFLPFGLRFLRHDPVVVRRAGGTHQDVVFHLLLVIVPVEDLFVVFLADQLVHDLFAAAGRDDHEHVPGGGADGLRQLEGGGDVALVALGEGGVDQELLAVFPEELGGAHYAFEGAGALAKVVVDCGAGAVQGEGDHLDVGLLHLLADFVGNERTVGRHAHPEAERGAVFRQLEDILPHQRLAAGEDHDRLREFRDLLDEILTLFRREIAFRGSELGGTAAVDAFQVAALGGLPGYPFRYELFGHGVSNFDLEKRCVRRGAHRLGQGMDIHAKTSALQQVTLNTPAGANAGECRVQG